MTAEQFEMLQQWAGPDRLVKIEIEGVVWPVTESIWLYDYNLMVGFRLNPGFTELPDMAEVAKSEKREQLAKLKAELGEP